MRVTISGPIGSGKSTAGRIISGMLGLKFFSGGYFFREKASTMGMTVEEFNVYAETHEAVDRDLDAMIASFLMDNDDVVVESRLAGWICHRSGISAFKVFLNASLDVRYARIKKREGDEMDLRERMVEREASEARRYLQYYGIDYSDTSIYDMVIGSDTLTAQEVAERIYERIIGEEQRKQY